MSSAVNELFETTLIGCGVLRKEIRNIIVVYGCCHPCLEDMLKEVGVVRTEGQNCIQLIRDIFHTDRKYLVGIKTICSGDYRADAETATRMVDLPLFWMDVSMDRFENILWEAVQKRIGSLPCPT